MKFGLDEEVIEKLQNVFANYDDIKKVIIYGSRAKGNYRKGSDIDLVLFGQNLSFDILSRLDEKIDNLYLPYLFDISIFNHNR